MSTKPAFKQMLHERPGWSTIESEERGAVMVAELLEYLTAGKNKSK